MASMISGDPPYTTETLRSVPFAERMRLICRTWLFQTYPTPVPVYIFYILKITLLYIGGWMLCCSFSPGMGTFSGFTEWAMTPTAFQKMILWSLFFEGIGMGCSMGPMAGRFLPPLGGFLYFLRPGTTKLPLFPGLPLIGGDRRTVLDCGLYAVLLGVLLAGLTASEINYNHLWPVALLIPILGITDKTIFLAARAEHYWVALVCLVVLPATEQWVPAVRCVWLAIWWWAATSKLNRHFGSVIAVMLTNSPFIPERFYRKLYRGYPDDLRAAPLAGTLGHLGTIAEYSFPLVLLFGDGGTMTMIGLIWMVSFHCFISGNLPMGMPIEWNVAMVFGGFVLFGANAALPMTPLLDQPLIVAFLAFWLIAVPLLGNFVPSRVSFLLSMRYYAGNWAYSVWLFRGDSQRKLDKLKKIAPLLRDQLAKLIPDEKELDAAILMTPSFRLMHLQGRALHDALPHAVDDLKEYEWVDGEMVAGLALGWNFGDGHLHGMQLLESVQKQCGFEPGELRVISVESQPFGGSSMQWWIADAADGLLREGSSDIATMEERQPWPDGELAEALDPKRTEA